MLEKCFLCLLMCIESAVGHIHVHNEYMCNLQRTFKDIEFMRLKEIGGLYITNPANASTSNDTRIFSETQAKRSLRALSLTTEDAKKKLQYFSKGENESKIYRLDNCTEQLLEGERYAIQNIGHATLLVQIHGFNILTDPVFCSLQAFLYPEKTRSHPDVDALPGIDVILISHNHRDHVDCSSLKRLLIHHRKRGWPEPCVLVPMGDRPLFARIGFGTVVEVEWYTRVRVTKYVEGVESAACFVSIPANHRSGRSGLDHHASLVTGWVFSPAQGNVVFKYSGDTRPLSDNNQRAVDAVLWNEMGAVKDIVCLEPSGPNYTRCDMDVTHQSTSYSALLRFIEAENLSRLSGRSAEDFLYKMYTLMMHHNKFELGPDRFNEGIFVLKKLTQYLDMCDEELDAELARQRAKLEKSLDKKKLQRCTNRLTSLALLSLPEKTSLLVHAKDFIICDIKEVEKNVSLERARMKEYIILRTTFLKIGERMCDKKIASAGFEVSAVHKYRKSANIHL